MTDNEIVKSLECCGRAFIECDGSFCNECPYMGKAKCQGFLFDNSLALINRQKEEIENLTKIAETQQTLAMDRHFEIERLKAEIERLQTLNFELSEKGEKVCIALKIAKAEAIKEIAERLKEEYPNKYVVWAGGTKSIPFTVFVDTLVCEMVGDTE